MIWQTAGAFVAVWGFSIVLEVPRKYIWYGSVIGALGWMIYLLMCGAGYSVVVSNFIAALGISFGAQILARICKTPVTLFHIAGIMPLVPGAGMYRIVYSTLTADTDMVTFYINQTLQIAGVISIAIFLVDVVFKQFLRRKEKSAGASFQNVV